MWIVLEWGAGGEEAMTKLTVLQPTCKFYLSQGCVCLNRLTSCILQKDSDTPSEALGGWMDEKGWFGQVMSTYLPRFLSMS